MENLITAVFIDIEDSTGIANYFKKDDYERFLKLFHDTVKNVIKSNKEWKIITKQQNYKFMGDEFIAFFPHNELGHEQALLGALHFAATLKFEWYFSNENYERLFGDKELIELNIGINTGAVSLMTSPILDETITEEKKSYEGFPITLAKRIQSVAEESQSSRIIVADRFFREYTAKAPTNQEFYYLGQKTFKGISQKYSCYEWTGDDFYHYLRFPEKLDEDTPDQRMRKTLEALYNKNPHNPWYASLYANYYFHLGEEEFWRGNENNDFYRSCAEICTNAIQKITKYNLRKLNELLFDCLGVTKVKWHELSFRTEQAYTSDPTFSRAYALRSKSLFMLSKKANYDKLQADEAKKEAERVLTLFDRDPKDYESLFFARFVLAMYYAKIEKNRKNMMTHINAIVDYVVKAKEEAKEKAKEDLDWVYMEYSNQIDVFEDHQHDSGFMKQIEILKEIYEQPDEE